MHMQTDMAWHEGGLFMGMHWVWWAFWVVVLAVLLAAFWRLLADRAEVRRSVAAEEQAEEALRRRFADGQIDEEEFTNKLRVLRETALGR